MGENFDEFDKRPAIRQICPSNLSFPTKTAVNSSKFCLSNFMGLAYFLEQDGTGRNNSGKYCKTNLRDGMIFRAFSSNQSHLAMLHGSLVTYVLALCGQISLFGGEQH